MIVLPEFRPDIGGNETPTGIGLLHVSDRESVDVLLSHCFRDGNFQCQAIVLHRTQVVVSTLSVKILTHPLHLEHLAADPHVLILSIRRVC